MIINLTNKQSDNLLSKPLLVDIQVPLYHTAHSLRHPLGIYNVSFSAVVKCFQETIVALHQVVNDRSLLIKNKKGGDRSTVNNLLASQKDLLYGLMEYLEDCDNILLSFFSSVKDRNKNTFVKLYRKATKEFRDHIGSIVNYLKHNQGRLQSIIFYNEELVLPGYFVVGATGESSLGPVQTIHHGITAFSFARDLRYNLFQFYAVTQHLSAAISGIQNRRQEANLLVDKEFDETMFEIVSGVSNLPMIFYPDERLKPIPSVIISNDNISNVTVTLVYPTMMQKLIK